MQLILYGVHLHPIFPIAFQCNSYLQFWHSVIKFSIKQCKLCIENSTSKNGIKRIALHLLQLALPQKLVTLQRQ